MLKIFCIILVQVKSIYLVFNFSNGSRKTNPLHLLRVKGKFYPNLRFKASGRLYNRFQCPIGVRYRVEGETPQRGGKWLTEGVLLLAILSKDAGFHRNTLAAVLTLDYFGEEGFNKIRTNINKGVIPLFTFLIGNGFAYSIAEPINFVMCFTVVFNEFKADFANVVRNKSTINTVSNFFLSAGYFVLNFVALFIKFVTGLLMGNGFGNVFGFVSQEKHNLSL